jgi:hypothetical protein
MSIYHNVGTRQWNQAIQLQALSAIFDLLYRNSQKISYFRSEITIR